jgi:GMP synthase (glutamine-hydrolysing)
MPSPDRAATRPAPAPLKVHWLQHVPFEDLGAIRPWLVERGARVSATRCYAEPSFPSPDELDWLIVMGGPMSVHDLDRHPWLADEAQLITRAIAAGKTVLGICLGAQLIAQVLGARVFPGEKREVGWAPVTLTDDGRDDPVFGEQPPTTTVFHLHGDTYELPADAKHLARSAVYEQQAFRWGEVVYGVQYHLEFTETMIGRLAAEPESRAYIAGAGVDPDRLVRESGPAVRQLGDVAQRVFENFFRQCGL